MLFPAGQPLLLGWITLQWPSPLMLLAALNLAIVWRRGNTTSRALSVAIAAMVLLHLFAWLAYGSQDGLHALCAAVGLMLILPISLRGKGLFPLVVAASVLVAAVSLSCAALLEPPGSIGARLIAGLANLAMFCAFWAGRSRGRVAVRKGGNVRRTARSRR
jgi:hypothetical protein